jgi:hypothetical protein
MTTAGLKPLYSCEGFFTISRFADQFDARLRREGSARRPARAGSIVGNRQLTTTGFEGH